MTTLSLYSPVLGSLSRWLTVASGLWSTCCAYRRASFLLAFPQCSRTFSSSSLSCFSTPSLVSSSHQLALFLSPSSFSFFFGIVLFPLLCRKIPPQKLLFQVPSPCPMCVSTYTWHTLAVSRLWQEDPKLSEVLMLPPHLPLSLWVPVCPSHETVVKIT